MKKIVAWLILVPILLTVGCTPKVAKVENGLYPALILEEELEGFGELTKLDLYTNNELITDGVMNAVRDNKKIYYSEESQRVVDYPSGYYFTIPVDLQSDFDKSGIILRFSADDLVITFSKESGNCQKNLAHDQRFIRDPEYRATNRIINYNAEIRVMGDFKVDILTMQLDEVAADQIAVFTHVNIYKESSNSYAAFLIKHTVGREFDLDAFLEGFGTVSAMGGNVSNLSYELTIPEYWSDETKERFERIQNQKHVDWGIFPAYVDSTGLRKTMPKLEEAIGEEFAIISRYWHISAAPKMSESWLNAIDERGYEFQMTFQFTTSNNLELNGYNPSLDIYRGEYDEYFRKLAASFKNYGKPVYLRLNNEMNTDWTSYSACATLCDPEMFVYAWQRMYDIFIEEGVDNTIWIFNCQDNSWPGRNWNHYLRFFPGVEYVQYIGLTAYNGGHSSWDSFDTLYAPLRDKLNEYFSEWPWIIGEFGCNAMGGDRPQWIRDMFSVLHEYPNIKAAIWFSANDYLDDGTIWNEYVLHVGGDTDAWRDGLKVAADTLAELYPNG